MNGFNTPGNADWMPDFEDPEEPPAKEPTESPADAAACSAMVLVREIFRLPQDSRPNYFKVYVAGEPLHENHDSESDAEEQAERIRVKILRQNPPDQPR